MKTFSELLNEIGRVEGSNPPTEEQRLLASHFYGLLLGHNFELNFTMSADSELCILRGDDDGTHYIIIGTDPGFVSYGFVGKNRGDYDSLHYDEEKGIELYDIGKRFVQGKPKL